MTLSSCGFTLRGQVNLDPRLAQVYVKGEELELVRRLEDGLEFGGSTIADSEGNASSVINLFDVEYTRETNATNSRGRVTSYSLKYNVSFRVHDAQGRLLWYGTPITATRTLAFSGVRATQKSGEEEFLQAEMQRDIVPRILRQIGSIGNAASG